MNKPLKNILVDIIKMCLNLPNNYGKTSRGDVIPSVIIYAQNIKLFNTDKLQITVRTGSFKTYSNRSEVKEIDGVFSEVQDLNQSGMVQIDCYSRNNDAENRYNEIIIAMNSVYAHQQMDLYNFKLGIIGNAVNNSGIDGGSDINRYTITYNAIIHFQKITPINYYDKFGITAETENGVFYSGNNYND